jgi:hypothetical protein
VLLPFEPKKKDEGYVLRNPSFIELDNLTELTSHNVNTLRVSTGDRSMFHREGGTFKLVQGGWTRSIPLSSSSTPGS